MKILGAALLLAFGWAAARPAAATGQPAQKPAKPAVAEWKGFTLLIPRTEGDASPDAFDVFYDADIHGKKGSVDLQKRGEKQAAPFAYDNSFKLFTLKRYPDDGDRAVWVKTPTKFTMYVHVEKGPPATTRLVVRAEDSPLIVADAPSIDKLGVKSLADYEAAHNRPIKDPGLNGSIVRDTPPPPPDAPTTPTAPKDDVAQAIEKLCAGACKKTELVFFSKALRDAPSLPNGDPNKQRLTALRERALKEAGGKTPEDAVSINLLRSDDYVLHLEAKQALTPDPEISAQLSEEELLADFCPQSKRVALNGGGAAFQQAQDINQTQTVAAGQAKPEDIAAFSRWDKQTLDSIQSKCDAFYRKKNQSDPRTVNVNGQNTQDPNAPGGGHTGNYTDQGDGKYHAKDHSDTPPPAEEKKTNPYKNAILGAKFGVWAGLLGMIFGGPAGAIVFGMAGAAAGYYISKYK